MESCRDADADGLTGNEEMDTVTCYYTEEGRPVYPEVKEEPCLFEIDTSGGMHIFSMGERFDGVQEAFKYLDSFFAMGEMKLEPTVDPKYVPPMEVDLPGTLRRSSRFNEWTPGKYYESD